MTEPIATEPMATGSTGNSFLDGPGVGETASTAVEETRAGSWSKAHLKLCLLIVAILASALVLHWSPLRRYVEDIQAMKAVLQRSGTWMPVVLALGSAVLIALGCPRLLFCAAAGITLGFAQGFFWSLVGALLGSYVTFLFVRWGGREWAAQKIARYRLLERLGVEPSVSTVFLIRQLPISTGFVNLLLGLSSTRHPVFLIGSLLGFVPEGFAVSLLSSGLGKSSAVESFLQISVAGLCLLLMGRSLQRLFRQFLFQKTPEAEGLRTKSGPAGTRRP